MLAWGVLVTESQRHRLAISELSANGFEHFQPYRESVKIRRGNHIRTRIPYFGRYMFVALCEAWRQITKLRGVAGILLDNQTLTPLRVCSAQLQNVRDKCDRNGVIFDQELSVTGLKYGDRVYVEKGSFGFIEGTYDGIIGKNKEQASFIMFGSEKKVTFKTGELKAMGK